MIRHIRLLLLLTPLIILACSNVEAQSVPGERDTTENSLHDGAWALQFQIDQYFSISSFQGTVLSVKRHFNAFSAMRLGFSATFGSGDESSNDQIIFPDTSQNANTTASSSTTSGFTLNLQYLLYPNPEDDINLFVGLGPLIQYSNNYNEYSQTSTSTIRNTTSDRDIWYLGVSGVVGVEWFATRSLSFHGEYGAALQYVTSKRTDTRSESSPTNGSYESVQNTEGESWRLYPLSVKFGLSAYF